MHKFQDFHFGNDLVEVILKISCWIVSFGIIIFRINVEGAGTLNAPLALSVFVFSTSCFSNTLIAIRHKKSGLAKFIHKFFLFSLLYLCVFSFFAALDVQQAPNFFVDSFYWIFGFLIALMILDALLIDFDPIKNDDPIKEDPKYTPNKEDADKFHENLHGK